MLPNMISRFSQMSWGEIQTRTRQSATKRIDLLKQRMGYSAVALTKDRLPTQRGQFFFSAEDLPCLTDLLKKHLPDEVQATVQEADQVCHHRFNLLGYEGLDYGPKIDWHLDKAHNKRAPLQPWFKIPF